MTCPKCSSANVVNAEDEAPPGARQWVKCWACGKRWDQAGSIPRGQDAEDAEVEEGAPPAPKRSSKDLVALVMRVAREHPETQTKERTMARCTKGACPDEAADDSVRCPKHRDEQRIKNAKYHGRPLPVADKPKRQYTRHIALGGKTATAVATIAPKALTAKPVRRVDLHGNVLTVLDGLIEQLAADQATLERAKEILEGS